MISNRLIVSCLALGLSLARPNAQGQPAAPRELKVRMFSVELGDSSPIYRPGARITVAEDGNSQVTNEQGLFRISLPRRLSDGREVTLIHDNARLLDEATEAYRLALTIFTHVDLPGPWAMVQRNLGRAIQIRARLAGFPAALEQVKRLERSNGLRDDPVAQSSLRTLALVCQLATEEDVEATRTLTGLIGHIERQPGVFRLVWDWDRLRSLIRESVADGIRVHRERLLNLLGAVSGSSRRQVLAGLKKVEDGLTRRSEPRK
jgi:hypothetical protein